LSGRARNRREAFAGQPLTVRQGSDRLRSDPDGRQEAGCPNPESEEMKKIVALFTLLVVLTACGGSRPSTDDIAKALKDKSNPAGAEFGGSDASDKIIDCIAKVLHDSDLSDKALKAIVDGKVDFTPSSDDNKAIAGLTDDLTTCVTG
jgi:hypothetical protein